MSIHGKIKRYALIVELIDRRKYPSFNTIQEHLFHNGFEISSRTIQRDIEQIRFEFDIEIKYEPKKNGYYIDKDETINMDSFFRFIEIANTSELLIQSFKEGKKILNHISFESQGNLKGIDNLKSILHAITQSKTISFVHINFETGRKNKYLMNPLLLKEYQNRWYAIGHIPKYEEFRTFGIDRIENIQILSKTFNPDSYSDTKSLFEHTIGLTYSVDEPQEVILSFTTLQGKYIKALPLHKSQVIIDDNENGVVIRLFVIPNYELTQKILMFGDTVKVLEPHWLVEEIIQILKKNLKKYND